MARCSPGEGQRRMPRTSPYRVQLTEAEREALAARARRYTSPYRDVIRAKIVLLAAQGLANDVIAVATGHAAPDRQQVAQAVLHRTPPGAGGAAPRRAPARFSPSVVVEVKALACELPARRGLPLARWSLAEFRREVMAQGLVAQISGATLWRWLSQDALRPWRHRSWIFPRDPAFAAKAGRILDLYERRWQGQPLGPRDYVICADEKTSIQARRRRHPTLPPRPGRPMTSNTSTSGAAPGPISPRGMYTAPRSSAAAKPRPGIAPFDRLVAQVMQQSPTARRAACSGSSTTAPPIAASRASRAAAGPVAQATLVHTPVHASWLNQIEIYFSIVQRKVLTPNDFREPDCAQGSPAPVPGPLREHRLSIPVDLHAPRPPSPLRQARATGRGAWPRERRPRIRHRNCEPEY